MELTRTWIDDARDPAMVRVCGQVKYDDRAGDGETYWVDLPRQCADDITATASPWAVALLPLAATLGQPLALCKPVDAVLLGNLRHLLRIWRCWYPKLSVVPIVADADVSSAPGTKGRTVAFFTGGLDSFFTLLRDRAESGEPRIDDLLSIWGLDIPLANTEAIRRRQAVLQSVADESGKKLITAATNRSQTRSAAAEWGRLAHACALVSVALMLEPRWSRVLIASSYGYADLQPWGSHPLTDPLLSTARTIVAHDGGESNRVEKTRVVAQSPLAMRSLRVCWQSASDGNCGACEKCYRTMTTLWLLGVLEKFSTFPINAFDPTRVGRIFCRSHGATTFMLENRNLAIASGRADVCRAIDRALASSRRLVRTQAGFNRLRMAIQSHRPLRQPISWLLDRVEWRLFRNVIW
jgi:hypothetical protein